MIPKQATEEEGRKEGRGLTGSGGGFLLKTLPAALVRSYQGYQPDMTINYGGGDQKRKGGKTTLSYDYHSILSF